MRKLFVVGFVIFSISHSDLSRAQWVHCGPQGGEVTSFVVLGSKIFASTSGNGYKYSIGGGVFLSADSGLTWSQVNNGLTDTNIVGLTSMDGLLFASDSSVGLYRSSDNGAHWNMLPALPVSNPVNSFAMISHTIFIATDKDGIWHSSDSGISWTKVNIANGDLTAYRLATNGTDLFANFYDNGNVYRSTNLGTSWTVVSTGVGDVVSTGNWIYGSSGGADMPLLGSSDEGKTWVHVDSASDHGEYYALASTGSVLFVANNGDNYPPVQHLIDTAWVGDTNAPGFIAVATLGPYLFIGNNQGVFRSRGHGNDWVLAVSGMYLFGSKPNQSGLLVSVGDRLISPPVKSSDMGFSWAVDTFLESHNPPALCSLGNDIFIGSDGSNGWGAVFRSIDDGFSWTETAPLPLHDQLRMLTAMGSILFIGTGYNGVYRSFDSGMTLTPVTGAGDEVTAFASSDSIIYVALTSDFITGGITYVSTNYGNSWNQIRSSNRWVQAMIAFGPDILIPETGDVMLSTDKGFSWNIIPTPLDFESFLNLGHTILAGTSNGVYQSTDAGNTWHPSWDGMGNINVYNFAIQGSDLYAGTDYGVWRRPLSDFWISSVTQTPPSPPQIQSYPNPFSHSTTVTFSSQDAGYAKVTVVNLLGAQVAQLFSGELAAGEHSFPWNASGMAPGLYECIVRMNGQVQRLSMSHLE